MMAKSPIGLARLACGAAVTAAAVAGGLLLTASGQAREVAPPPPPPIADIAPPARPLPPRTMDEIRRTADQARAEARRRVAEAHRDVHAADREAARAGRVARSADIAARHAEAMMAIVPPPPPRIPDVGRMVQASLDRARADLAARCAAQGVTMPRDADFAALATCGDHYRETIRTALVAARASVARDRALSDEMRAEALSGIDRAIAEQDRRVLTHN